MFLSTKKLSRFERTPFQAAKVRNVSRVGATKIALENLQVMGGPNSTLELAGYATATADFGPSRVSALRAGPETAC
ncbi:hypothetical protein SBA3_510008 [Candidatus Sulfopaludibacter sp. SbA3]|nr:hypothetical protein SBA3_510008 [Candidatus Sulfopaludibacter sp. SbA3]